MSSQVKSSQVENLAEPDEEERALLLDGGREWTARLMREASAVGARAWFTSDGGGRARTARAHDAHLDGAAVDDTAAPLQVTQGYGMSQVDDDEEAGADEAVRRAPTWHATQQYGRSQEDGEGGDDDNEAVRRPSWSDARTAESPRMARWAACGHEMDDELTGEPSEAGADVECLSALAPGNEHDETMSDVGAEAEALVCVAEREQQREVLVECAVCVGARMWAAATVRLDECTRARAVPRAAWAPTVSSRGQRERCTRPRAMMGTRP